MYGYIRQGRRTALTRETIGGVPFWVLTAGQGLLRRRGVRRRRGGVGAGGGGVCGGLFC